VQDLATLRDLDDFGPAAALAPLPVRRKLRVLRSVSAHFLTYLRKRGRPPLVVTLEDATPTLTLGGTFLQAGTPTKVLDVMLRFAAGGTVGAPGVTYKVSVDGGASFGAVTALPLNGAALVDGITTTFGGSLALNDQLAYATQAEEELRLHVVGMASWYLLRNRGLDPAVEQELRESFDAAKAWLGDTAVGDAELDGGADATPERDEGGPLADTRVSPYSWVKHGRGWEDE
jgi:hypothetical protein